jgi:catechol 2,3-dioxygenase-like lactoylglutathione lyase family enzyme
MTTGIRSGSILNPDSEIQLKGSPMTASAKLTTAAHVAFVPINDKDKALAFYRDQLGLTFVEDQSPFALVFDLNGTIFRVTFAGEFTPQRFTILGWSVVDIEITVKELTAAGVQFTRYPGMNDTHPLAIWTAPGGTQIAWFTDPFGNTLSLQQNP